MTEMLNQKTKRRALALGMAMCVSLFIYSLMGLLQAIFLFGAGPGFSENRFITNLEIWGTTAALSLGLFFYLVMRYRMVKR
jgi:hypothetical protein